MTWMYTSLFFDASAFTASKSLLKNIASYISEHYVDEAQRADSRRYILRAPTDIFEDNEIECRDISEAPAFLETKYDLADVIEKRSYLTYLLRKILDLPELHNNTWLSRGKVTKKGHPHHPLYVKSGTPFETFDMELYKKSLNLSP